MMWDSEMLYCTVTHSGEMLCFDLLKMIIRYCKTLYAICPLIRGFFLSCTYPNDPLNRLRIPVHESAFVSVSIKNQFQLTTFFEEFTDDLKHTAQLKK